MDLRASRDFANLRELRGRRANILRDVHTRPSGFKTINLTPRSAAQIWFGERSALCEIASDNTFDLETHMKILKATLTLALTLCALTSIQASEMNQTTVFTFSNPVALPGTVLPAGTYVFKLLNSSSDRNIVQVFNKEENQFFGTFLAIPDYRLNPHRHGDPVRRTPRGFGPSDQRMVLSRPQLRS